MATKKIKRNRITKSEVWNYGTSIVDYPIDVNMQGEQESNGSTEHQMFYKGNFYYLQVGWDESLGRLTKMKNVKREVKENLDGILAEFIKVNKIQI
jgi:hypothetical protein